MKTKSLTLALLLCAGTLFAGNDPKITEVSLDNLRAQKDSVQMDDNDYLKRLGELQSTAKKNVANIDKAIGETKDELKKLSAKQKANAQQRSSLKTEDKNLAKKGKLLQQERNDIEKEQKLVRKDKVLTSDEKAAKEKALKERTETNKRDCKEVDKRRDGIKADMGKLDKSDEELANTKKRTEQTLASYQTLRSKWDLECTRIKDEMAKTKTTIKNNKKLAQ